MVRQEGPPGATGAAGAEGAAGAAGAPGATGAEGQRGLRGLPHWVSVVGYLLLAVGIVSGLGLDYHQEQGDREDRVKGRYFVCLEIEKLKAGERKSAREDYVIARTDAIEVYERLPITLRLLRIPGSPEVTAEAKRSRDRKIRRAAQERDRKLRENREIEGGPALGCARFARDPGGLNVRVPEVDE